MHLLTIPPGGWAKAHYHEAHETAIYCLSGESSMWYGDELAEHLTLKTGEYLYIPAGVPHQPYNPSDSQPCTAVLARTDPNEQESVVLIESDKERPPRSTGRPPPRPPPRAPVFGRPRRPSTA